MSNITDNTGAKSLVDYAGVVWTKTTYSSYHNHFSADGQFVVTQSFNRFFWLYVRTADGYRKVREAFVTAKDAMVFAAGLIEVAA